MGRKARWGGVRRGEEMLEGCISFHSALFMVVR